jgi:SAM-dependent methyltransferase
MTNVNNRNSSASTKIKAAGLTVARKLVPPGLRRKLDPIRRFFRKFDSAAREQDRLDDMIGPFGYWSDLQEYHLELFKSLGLQPQHRLMDIGCGPLPAGLPLISYLDPGNYFGIDLRGDSIAEAHVQVAKAGLAEKNPHLIVSSTFGLEETDGYKFDYVYASQMTYHLDPDLIAGCLERIASCLKPHGAFYGDFLSDPELAKPGKRWHEYTFHFHSLERLTELSKSCGLEMTNLGEIRQFGYPVDWKLKHNYLLKFSLA